MIAFLIGLPISESILVAIGTTLSVFLVDAEKQSHD